jgi:hypothetical protein
MSADPAQAVIRRGIILTVLALIGVAAVMVMAIKFTPVEANQGLAQKIFYIHVPSAGYLPPDWPASSISGCTTRESTASPPPAPKSRPSSVSWS